MWDDKEISTCLNHFELCIDCKSDLSNDSEADDAFITLQSCFLLSDTVFAFFIIRLQSCALILDDIADSSDSYSVAKLTSNIEVFFT